MHPNASTHLNKPLNKQQGFTLLELLIASIIFAVMAVMAYGGLSNVMDNSEASKRALLRLKQIQQTVSILNRDFSQIIQRSIRDEYGNPQPFLTTQNDADNIVELTRGGRSSPPVLARSSLVRVAYRFDDDKLVRLQWPQLDRSPNMEAKKSILIENVENVSVRFLDKNKEWQQEWPPLNALSPPPPPTGSGTPATPTIDSPLAIEIILQLNDWGEIRRLYALK